MKAKRRYRESDEPQGIALVWCGLLTVALVLVATWDFWVLMWRK